MILIQLDHKILYLPHAWNKSVSYQTHLKEKENFFYPLQENPIFQLEQTSENIQLVKNESVSTQKSNSLPDMPILGSYNSAGNKDIMSKIWTNGDTII